MGKCGEGYHLTGAVSYIPVVEVLRQHSRWRITLDVHALQPAAIDEVIDVGRPPRTRDRIVDYAESEALRACPLPVDGDSILRLIVEAVGPHAGDQWILGGQAQQLAARLHQCSVTQANLVDQLEVKAGRIPQL